jgi:Protein of unknown function (DUF3761)
MRFTRPSHPLAYTLVLAIVFLSQQIVSQTQPSPRPSQDSGTSSTSPNQGKVNCTDTGTYVNSKGQAVKRPENCSEVPQGATAQCRDGTYSFSRSRRGTCSHHGGVRKWL